MTLQESSSRIPYRDPSPDTDIMWGAAAIARCINRTERQTYHLLELGEIQCARKKGDRWCASRSALLKEFGSAA
jgi:hypothetical protein